MTARTDEIRKRLEEDCRVSAEPYECEHVDDLEYLLARVRTLEQQLFAGIKTHGEPCDSPGTCEFMVKAQAALGEP